MTNLYQCVKVEFLNGFVPTAAQNDILTTWGDRTALFSAGQVAQRNDISRRSARRTINRLIELGLVKRWC